MLSGKLDHRIAGMKVPPAFRHDYCVSSCHALDSVGREIDVCQVMMNAMFFQICVDRDIAFNYTVFDINKRCASDVCPSEYAVFCQRVI